MKYALNHSHKFKHPYSACLAGLLQFLSSLFCEVVNFMVIVSSETVLDVIKDFLALLVISDIGNIFFGEQTPGLVKNLITD